jgi:hypothetical protein
LQIQVLQHLVRSNAFGMQSPLLQALLPTVFESIFVDFQSQTRSPTSMHDMLYSLKPFFVQVNLLNDVVLSHETRIQNIEKSMVKLTSRTKFPYFLVSGFSVYRLNYFRKLSFETRPQ